jgi:hypothetical protein
MVSSFKLWYHTTRGFYARYAHYLFLKQPVFYDISGLVRGEIHIFVVWFMKPCSLVDGQNFQGFGGMCCLQLLGIVNVFLVTNSSN